MSPLPLASASWTRERAIARFEEEREKSYRQYLALVVCHKALIAIAKLAALSSAPIARRALDEQAVAALGLPTPHATAKAARAGRKR